MTNNKRTVLIIGDDQPTPYTKQIIGRMESAGIVVTYRQFEDTVKAIEDAVKSIVLDECPVKMPVAEPSKRKVAQWKSERVFGHRRTYGI